MFLVSATKGENIVSSTILELQSQIEELEKRIKAISNAQTLHQQLSALQTYFDSIQDCLSEMNTTLDGVLLKNSEQDASLTSITNSIASINSQLSSLSQSGAGESGGSDFDSSQIEADITSLSQSLQSLSTEISNLKNGSTTNLSAIETDIDALQTDLGYAEDAIEQNASDISTINSTIGEQQTVITNLQTTQTNLSTSQSSLSSTVSGINSRLSTVESNISNLSGGVDFSDYQNRLDLLEKSAPAPYGYGYQRFVLLTSSDRYLVTPEIFIGNNLNGMMNVVANFNYTSNASGTLTLTAYLNGEQAESINIDLSKYPNGYCWDYSYLPTAFLQRLKFTLQTSATVTYSELKIRAYASGANLLSYHKDLEIRCAGGKILAITRDNNGIKYKFYNPGDNIRSTAISTRIYNYDNDNKYTFMSVEPYAYVENGVIKDHAFGIIKVNTAGVKTIEPIVEKNSEYSFFDKTTITMNSFCMLDGMNYPDPYFLLINNNNPGYQRLIYNSTTGTFTGLSGSLPGNWLYIVPIRNNNLDVNSTVRAEANMMAVGLYQDGYMYAIFKAQNGYGVKLAKGTFATAYEELDGSINVYVSDYYKTTKFKLVMGSNNKYEISTTQNVPNVNCVYETYNNHIFAYYPKSKSWSSDTLTY